MFSLRPERPQIYFLFFFLKVEVLDGVAHQELGFHVTSGKICSKITRVGSRGFFSLKGPAQLGVPERSFLAGAAPALQMPGEGCKLMVSEDLPPLGSMLVSVLRPTEEHQLM